MGAKSSKQNEIDKMDMDESRRLLIKIIMINRNDFRQLFGLECANQCGYFIDRNMSAIVHSFADGIIYPMGDYVLSKHYGSTCSAFSCDGYRLFTGSFDNSIMVHHLITKKRLRHWIAHSGSVWCLKCHRSGILVSGSADHSIRVWDAFTFELQCTLEGHAGSVYDVDVNKDGTRLVSATSGHRVLIWSLISKEILRLITGHFDIVRSVHFVGDWVISGGDDHSIRVWDASNGHETGIMFEDVTTVSVNSDHSMIASLNHNGCSVYSWPDLDLVITIRDFGEFGGFHPKKPNVLALRGNGNRQIKFWDVSSDVCLGTLETSDAPMTHVSFSPDGSRLVSVNDAHITRVWDLSDIHFNGP